MEEVSQLTEFGKVFICLVGGSALVLFILFLGKLIAPNHPTQQKASTYECGEVSQGSAWIQFNPRFYVIALVFLLFDVEIVFIFPWTTVFGSAELIHSDSRWGWYTLAEMFVFVGILVVGLVYVWKKGDLEWIRPLPKVATIKGVVPMDVYERLNHEHYKIRPMELPQAIPAKDVKSTTTEDVTVKKPFFKPRFAK